MADLPRSVLWEKIDHDDWLTLIANDLDKLDARQERIDSRLGKIMAVCVSILVSLVTASILLIVNIGAGGGP